MSKSYLAVKDIAAEIVAPAMAEMGMEADTDLAWCVATQITWRSQTGAYYVTPKYLNREELAARIIEING